MAKRQISFLSTPQEDGKTSWIDLALAADLDGATQYITSLRYVAGPHLGPSLGRPCDRGYFTRIVGALIFAMVIYGYIILYYIPNLKATSK